MSLQWHPIISEVLWVRQRARGWLTNVTPSLRGLFPLSAPWPSSRAPSHRPSTFEPCVLLMPFSWTWTASKLCRWLGGSSQRIPAPYFIWSSSSIHIIFLRGVLRASHPKQYILWGGLKVLPKLSFSYILIISKSNNNVKAFLAFFIRISWKVGRIILHPYPQ